MLCAIIPLMAYSDLLVLRNGRTVGARQKAQRVGSGSAVDLNLLSWCLLIFKEVEGGVLEKRIQRIIAQVRQGRQSLVGEYRYCKRRAEEFWTLSHSEIIIRIPFIRMKEIFLNSCQCHGQLNANPPSFT